MVPNVLLVDDDPHLLAGLQRAFRGEPFRVLVAEHGEAALAQLGAHHVDVIVADEEMPGMSGADLLARVSKEYPSVIPIVLTGSGRVEAAARAINESGVYRFFTKPCNAEDLSVAIREVLRHRDEVATSRQLIQVVREESDVAEAAERQSRGFSSVERDETGAIIVSEVDIDLEELQRELNQEEDAPDSS